MGWALCPGLTATTAVPQLLLASHGATTVVVTYAYDAPALELHQQGVKSSIFPHAIAKASDMRISDLKTSGIGLVSSSISSLCCLLPLAVVALGLGSGAFMAVTMRYSSIFIPMGLVGVSLGYYLYFRERRRCAQLVCQMAGSRVNLALLLVSTLILISATTLVAFPSYTNALIASMGGEVAMGSMQAKQSGAARQTVTVQDLAPRSDPPVVEARVTLQVDGIT